MIDNKDADFLFSTGINSRAYSKTLHVLRMCNFPLYHAKQPTRIPEKPTRLTEMPTLFPDKKMKVYPVKGRNCQF